MNPTEDIIDSVLNIINNCYVIWQCYLLDSKLLLIIKHKACFKCFYGFESRVFKKNKIIVRIFLKNKLVVTEFWENKLKYRKDIIELSIEHSQNINKVTAEYQ